jgi:hypothetical protein
MVADQDVPEAKRGRRPVSPGRTDLLDILIGVGQLTSLSNDNLVALVTPAISQYLTPGRQPRCQTPHRQPRPPAA